MNSHVGPYRILRLIDRGGQGGVYLGYDERLERRVAVKIYALPEERKSRRALLREARLVAGLQSNKVVQIYDVIESDTHLGLVMEYIPGCNLEQFLQAARPSIASAVTVATDVAAALTAAHHAGVVHGDVKAANVLLTESGRARLADFGIARRGTAQGAPGGGPGTLSALSPEQYRGDAPSYRSDLFALGLLMYRMLAGIHPYYRGGQFAPELLLSGAVPPLSEAAGGAEKMPPELLSLVNALLRENPEQRVPSSLRARQALLKISRALPANAAGSLLRESQPLFRNESAEDLPLRIPGGFSRQARAHFIGSGNLGARLWHRLKSLQWPARIAVVTACACVLATPLLVAARLQETVVRFQQPVITAGMGVKLPRELDRQFLLAAMKATLLEELGRLDVIGHVDAGPRAVRYSPRAELLRPQEPEEEFAIELSCVDTLCVLAVRRMAVGRNRLRQSAVLAQLSPQEWQRVVRQATRDLFD